MGNATQQVLDIDVETFTQREKYLISLLREFRTIDAEIWRLEQLARGDDLIHEPSITVAPQAEDRIDIQMEVRASKFDDEQQKIIELTKRYVRTDGQSYATYSRVAEKLSSIEPETEDEKETLILFMQMLRTREEEERVELTSTERLAVLRGPEIQKARMDLTRLHIHKVAVSSALRVMDIYYPPLYSLLWNRYVMGRGWIDVCALLGDNGTSLTEKEYRNRRKNALQLFDRFCILKVEK